MFAMSHSRSLSLSLSVSLCLSLSLTISFLSGREKGLQKGPGALGIQRRLDIYTYIGCDLIYIGENVKGYQWCCADTTRYIKIYRVRLDIYIYIYIQLWRCRGRARIPREACGLGEECGNNSIYRNI